MASPRAERVVPQKTGCRWAQFATACRSPSQAPCFRPRSFGSRTGASSVAGPRGVFRGRRPRRAASAPRGCVHCPRPPFRRVSPSHYDANAPGAHRRAETPAAAASPPNPLPDPAAGTCFGDRATVDHGDRPDVRPTHDRPAARRLFRRRDNGRQVTSRRYDAGPRTGGLSGSPGRRRGGPVCQRNGSLERPVWICENSRMAYREPER